MQHVKEIYKKNSVVSVIIIQLILKFTMTKSSL